MPVVRKELRADEVYPAALRLNSGVVQRTPDGGTTWNNSPADDPRLNVGNLLPHLTSSTRRCDAAERMTAALQEAINTFISSTTATGFAVDIAEIVVLLLGPVGILFDLFILIADALFAIGISNINAAFTAGVYSDIKCIIYCELDADGQMSDAALSRVLAKIATTHPGVVSNTIVEVFQLFGHVGFSNAGVERSETGSCGGCASCGWTVEYDLRNVGQDGWVFPHAPTGGYPGPSYTYGTPDPVYQGNNAPVVEVELLTPGGVHVTDFQVEMEFNHGNNLGSSWALYKGTSPTLVWSTTTVSDNTPIAWRDLYLATWDATTAIWLVLKCSNNGTGHVYLRKIRISGTGPLPPGGVQIA